MLPKKEYARLTKDVVTEKISEIAPNKEWLAIVHADGNGLGKIIQQSLEGGQNADFLKEFSEKLGAATEQAAQDAYTIAIQPKLKEGEKLPFRPILLGGDDFTLIIRGDLALSFTEAYLEAFEWQTQLKFKDLPNINGLSACAGIAYIKPNYPFHYGVDLAEGLTKHVKKIAKNLDKNSQQVPSCLAFHKVQSSFIGTYADIIERELKASATGVSFKNGPYFLEKQKAEGSYNTLKELRGLLKTLQNKDAPKSGLREWLTELQTNRATAQQLRERILSLNFRFKEELLLITDRNTTPIYDALIIDSIEKKTN